MELERDVFMESAGNALGSVYDTLNSLEEVRLKELMPGQTVLIAVDMINGFAKAGALYSPRIEALIPGIAELAEKCGSMGIQLLSFGDAHTADSPEFSSYPLHSLEGSDESELVEELKSPGFFSHIQKNSTNGFLEPEFQIWLGSHDHIHTFIFVGDCTDICIQQFATTLKCHFNRKNRSVRVIVPADMVDTFDMDGHNGDLMHAMALMMLMGNGVEVVRRISNE